MSGEASAAFWTWVEALRAEHLKFSGFIPKEISALDAWVACWAQKDAELAAVRAERNALAVKTAVPWVNAFGDAANECNKLRERAEKAEAEAARLRATLLDEAEYCYGYARKYESADEGRAARHRERGDRLKRAALGER